MLKKLRERKESNNSMLTLALEINQQHKIQSIKFPSIRDNRQFNAEKRNTLLRTENIINGQTKPKLSPLTKRFKEDEKENQNQNTAVKKYIEFFDELNKKKLIFDYWDEKFVKFSKSDILPKVKLMKVDNDVMTDSEQRNDALAMMRDNLKQTIKLIRGEKDYLVKNLSKKIKFKKH
jgi:hypothetical protein